MEVNLSDKTPDIRYLKDMEKVVYDQEWFKTADLDLELYYMYRMVEEKNGLRYDVTVIPPNMLGKEFAKTKGHTHAGYYGEIYIVLEGEGMYFMQKGDENKIDDVCAVRAKKGDVISIPAGYGHVTINPSKTQKLKMANWVKKEDKGNFSLFEKNQGACYYYTKHGWIKNEKYENIPELRFEQPLKSVPENLDFLK
ncbi:MAG: cupin domain-containing protein [Candidatus Nealsonbacteria bacterium]|nr:cupin domain-containing protein [Candidatus Nealsonbacteria bacterium]